jgi:hypothetical protein
LESGYADDDGESEASSSKKPEKTILLKMDEKTGLVTPAVSVKGKVI